MLVPKTWPLQEAAAGPIPAPITARAPNKCPFFTERGPEIKLAMRSGAKNRLSIQEGEA